VCLAVLIPASAVSAQDVVSQSRSVTGVVVDAAGGTIAGATVVIRSAGMPARQTTTDDAGRFEFKDLASGGLAVTASAARFQPFTLDLARPAPVRIVLQPMPVTEHVTVVAPMAAERITSAMKTDTPMRDVPQAVTVITREAIAERSMQSMADVVRYVPGVGMAQGEGNRDTPVFRGNSSTSDFYVDGARDDVQYFRDLYNVERVEALKGPNAMIFGRGGVGGVINRVTRQANWSPVRQATFEGGSFGHRRLTADLGHAVNGTLALRLTGMFEDSDSYRQGVGLNRYGVNPTMAVAMGRDTTVRAGYEHFHDDRTADRGVPSFDGRPFGTDASTFFGDPANSRSRATVDALSASLDHQLTRAIRLRSRISAASYDKFYQNIYPASAVDSTGSRVSLSAYNNAADRRNLFSQTDLVARARTHTVAHVLLAGVELGRQVTENFRNTGYFTTIGPTTTSVNVAVSAPQISLPLTFRQSVTDADNRSVGTVAAVYAQDQIELSRQFQGVIGLRVDRFQVEAENHRTGAVFTTDDRLVSPRAALLFKPATSIAFYTSYTLSYLPRAGEQLSSLSLTNQALDPETFRNYEVGARWQIRPALFASAALYRLDRGNVVVPDPADSTRSILVDGQRSRGLEMDLGGHVTRQWSVLAAYAHQHGEITRTQSATVQAGARLAQLPAHTLSLWNRYEVTRRLAAGVGIVHRSDVFTSTDNTVTLPRFTEIDAAVFFSPLARLRGQINVENLFDQPYYQFSNGNNNITPGSPRAVRVSVTAKF
jgi:catecholate siderophore receptor